MSSMIAFGVNDWNEPATKLELKKPIPGPRDLLVKNYAAGLNPVDFKRYKNLLHQDKPAEPVVAGYDSAGVVEAVGNECKLYKVGDHVYFSGNLVRNGTLAEYTVVDERIVGKKPAKLSWLEAATVPLTAITAWESLVEQMGIAVPKTEEEKKHNSTRTILIIAGAGGVGSIAIQLAKHVLHLTVIATASRPSSVAFCKSKGADYVIDHSKPYAPQLKELKIVGADYILNNAPFVKPTWNDCAEALNPLGKIVLLADDGEVDLMKIKLKRGTVAWELMFTRPLLNVEPEKQKALLDEVSRLLDAGVVHHSLVKTVPFTEAGVQEGLKLLESNTVIGKIGVDIVKA